MEREIINKEPYQLEGIEYLYFYDRANALVICTMPYGYEERKADEDWDLEYGGSLFDTITVEGKKYVELESVGLANENWQNQAERDEYLRRWANDIKRQVKAEVLVNTPNDHEPSEKENVLEDESDDLRQLVNELKNNGMEQTAEQVSQLMNQVDNMTNMVQGLMNEISRLNESIQDMQDSRLPNRIKKSLNEDVERIEKRYEETKEQVSEIRDDIKIKAGNIMDDYKMRGKAALNRMLEFIELKSKLTNVRDNMLHGIEDIDRTLGKIDVLGKGMRDAGNLVANTIRNVTDKETIDYSSREKKFSKTELIKKPWIAQRKLYEVFVQSLNVIIDKVDGLSKTVKTEMNEEQISGQQEQEAVDQDPVDEVQENAELQHSKLQTFDEFLEENYEMTSEQFEHVGTYERRTIEDEYKEMVNAITGKDPWEVARESEDHAVSFDDKLSSASIDKPQIESDRDIDEEILDAFDSEVDMKTLVNNFYKEYQAAGGELSHDDVRDCLITNNLEKLYYLSDENRDLFSDAKDVADQIENMAYDGDLSLKEQTQAILASLDKDKFPESVEKRLNQVLDIYGAKDVADEIYLKTPFGITQLSQVEVAPNIDDGFTYKDLDTGISYAFHADDIDGVAADKGEFFTSDLDRLDNGDQALLMTYGNEKQGYDVAVWNEPDGKSQFVVADAGKLQEFLGGEYNKDGRVLAMGEVPQSMYDKSILEVSNMLAESVMEASLEGYQASCFTRDLSRMIIPKDTPVILPVQAEFGSFDVHCSNYQIADCFAKTMENKIPDRDVINIRTRQTTEGKRMTDALMEHYGNVSEREGLLRTRISLVTAVTEQHEHIYGPVYNRFNIAEKISNCINNMRLGNADGTFEMAIRENLQRYTTKQHKIDRLNDMAYLDENIRQVVNQQGETSKEIEQAARTGDYKAVKQKTDLFLEQGEKIIELREDKFQKQIYDLQQMKWDNMLNADVWIKQPQPHKCELEDGTKVFMDYRLNDVAAKSLRAGHENDIISDGYPNGYYLGTMNGYPQLIIHTQDKIIVSRSMTDDYSEGKSLADISNDLYQEYWNDMNRVEMKDMSMDNQIATELVTALAKVDAAYEVEQVDSLKEIEQRSGQSYRELYYEKRDECRLDKALVPKVGIASELEDGTYSLREVRIIDERLADIIKNNTEQVDTGNLSADVKPGDFLLLKDNIMEPYQTFMVTEDGLMQAGDSRKAEVCNRYCTDQMLSSSFDVDMEQKCVKPLVEHGVTLQPGIQTRFEKNAKMFEMKNPVAPEQRKIQQNKIEMSM